MNNDKKKQFKPVNFQKIVRELANINTENWTKSIQILTNRTKKDWDNIFANFIENFKLHRELFDEKYKLYEPAMKRIILEREGNVPDSPDEMYEIWFKKILPLQELDDIERTLEREDFFRFDEIMEEKLIAEYPLKPEVKAKIKAYADGGKKKYREPCIAILTGYEKMINVLKPINKTSVIVRQIKQSSYFNYSEKQLPTHKIVCGWIEGYNAMYHGKSKNSKIVVFM